MSTPAAQTPTVSLLYSVLEFLTSLKNNSAAGSFSLSDPDSLDVSLQCLSEATGLKLPNPAPGHYSLSEIYLAGLTSLASSTSDVVDSAGFTKFLDLLKQKNFFGDSKPGTVDYANKLIAAKIKYNQRFPNAGQTTATAAPVESAPAAAPSASPVSIDENTRKRAEQAKTEGNNFLGQQKYREAIERYSHAISLNPNNAIYYSNRAAAQINLKNWSEAVNDSIKAIEIDESYAKAHYRLGQAYFNQGKTEESIAAYQKALSVAQNDPTISQSIQEQLAIAVEKLNNPSGNQSQMTENEENEDEDGGAGDFDFASLMNNPAMANLASQFGGAGGAPGGLDINALLSNPAMMNMAANMFGGAGAGAAKKPKAQPAASAPPAAAASSASDPLAGLLNSAAGKEMMNDPELVAAMEDFKANGASVIGKYMSNPNIMAKITKMMGM